MKIALGSDHAGFYLKEFVKNYLEDNGHEVVDFGAENGTESVDYPDFARKVAQNVANGEFDRGVLMCGSGIGMSIAANRFDGVRATLCEDEERTELARRHNNSNILVLPGRYLGTVKAARMVDIWLETDFDGGRHSRRVEKIDK